MFAKMVVAVLLVAAAASECPGSAAWVRASARVEVRADQPCSTVVAEMRARVTNQGVVWHDPHNNGTYSILSDRFASDSQLELQRVTHSKKYTDKLMFTFHKKADNVCYFFGCSESQVFSVMDYSTNYCNLRMLYCNRVHGCKPVQHDFETDETSVTTSIGAAHDPKACLALGIAQNTTVSSRGHSLVGMDNVIHV